MENNTINDKIQAFSELLDGLKVADKKRELWKEIYSHALQDRTYALQMYVSVSNLVVADPTQHAIHGPNIAKYIERMSRSNDQLLKLAELVAAAEEISESGKSLSPDEIYEQLAAGDAIAMPKKASNKNK